MTAEIPENIAGPHQSLPETGGTGAPISDLAKQFLLEAGLDPNFDAGAVLREYGKSDSPEDNVPAWSADLLRPDVQARLSQDLMSVFRLERLNLTDSDRTTRSNFARISHILLREDFATVRQLYLLGGTLKNIHGINDATLATLKNWLVQLVPEMPPLFTDESTSPACAAFFCTDVSQIMLRDIPALFGNRHLVPPISLAEYVDTFADAARHLRTICNDAALTYIALFEAAKDHMRPPADM